jgi:hypothetical protein
MSSNPQDAPQTGRPRSYLWYIPGQLHVYPSKASWEQADAIEELVLPGWVPPEPPLTPDSKVLAVGSCFARQVAFHLWERGQGHGEVGLFVIDGRLLTTFAILRHFEWALGKRELESDETLYVENTQSFRMGVPKRGGRMTRELVPLPLDDETRGRTREVIEASDAFIFTLGLAEMWFSKATGEAFLAAVPRLAYDPERHENRLTTVAENRDNLVRLVRAIREKRPDAPIVFSLSPQRMIATFRPMSCVTANVLGKSILRAAIEEAMGELGDEQVYYWPSYEIVTEAFGRDGYRDDGRHVDSNVSKVIVDLFARYFIRESK